MIYLGVEMTPEEDQQPIYTILHKVTGRRQELAIGGVEEKFPEAAVMMAIAFYILENTTDSEIAIHPDGQHANQFDIQAFLAANNFEKSESKGTTAYGGLYQRENKTLTVFPKSGLGDVVSDSLVVECKGGTINSNYAGVSSQLRRSLFEVVGQLMAREPDGKRMVAAVPFTTETEKWAVKLAPRCRSAAIEVALMNSDGSIVWATDPGD